MKTKDFIETLQDKNYCVEVVDNKGVYVSLLDGSTLAYISSACMGELIISANISFIEDMEERAWLVEHIACFAATPIDNRFESKKYYVRHKWLGSPSGNFLNAYRDGLSLLSTKLAHDNCSTQFTEREIESLKRKNDTDLKDFEIIEVEE